MSVLGLDGEGGIISLRLTTVGLADLVVLVVGDFCTTSSKALRQKRPYSILIVSSVGLNVKVELLEDAHSIKEEDLRDPVNQSEGVLKDVSYLEKLAQVHGHILAVLGEYRHLADHSCDGFETVTDSFEDLLS